MNVSKNLKCFVCQKRFNLDTREPIILLCCYLTACRECVTTKMIKNKDHAKMGVAKRGEFECSGCCSDYYSHIDTDEPIPIKCNKIVKELIA